MPQTVRPNSITLNGYQEALMEKHHPEMGRRKMLAADSRYEENGERERPSEGANDSIAVYYGSIRKYRLLTFEEEKHLAERIAKGDVLARNRMIESNLRLVVNIAKRYISRGVPFGDLIEDGNIGLIKAVERFKPNKGCRFSTYATYWIKQSIERSIAKYGATVRLPIHITTDLSKVTRAAKDLMMALEREPDPDEIAQKTGLSGRYVKKLSMYSRKSCSLNASLPEDSEQSFIDRLEDEACKTPPEEVDAARRYDRVNGLLERLEENERKVIKMRFGFDGEPKTLEAVGKCFGVTRERARQIESKAIVKLKNILDHSRIRPSDVL